MKNDICCLLTAFVMALSVAGCAHSGNKDVSTVLPSGQHPDLTSQEKLVACSECHREATPELYRQWYDSRHGLDQVKCFQCHGTFEDLRVYPDESRCAACHNAQFQHSVKGKKCWECHPAHGFSVHK